MESRQLRIALLSSVERTPDGALRAFQRIGGRSVIAWQVDLARELGCERVVCLCEGTSPDLIDLQRQVEAAGLTFNLIRGSIHLVGLVSADQDIVAIADGLVIDRKLAVDMLADRRGILALPAEAGIAAGFERIDAEHAWAGVFVARANIAAQMADLPPDSNTMSLLLRLALQGGTRRIPLDKDRLISGEVLLAIDRTELDRREKALLEHGGERTHWSAPGHSVSNWLARRLAPDALARGPAIASAVAASLGLGSVVLAGLDHPFAAICTVAAGSFALGTGRALRAIKARLHGQEGRARFPGLANLLLDLLAIVVLTLPSLPLMIPKRAFLPMVMIGLLRLAAGVGPSRWRAMWGDRVLLFVLLFPAAWFGTLTQAMAVIALVSLAYCLISQRKFPITTD